jgi:hypothetical protein
MMGCRGDGCDLSASHVRVKATAQKRPEVELFLRDLFDGYIREGNYAAAEKLFREELKEVKKCPKCGRELPDLVPLGEFSCCDGVPDICPFCGCDLWCYEEKKPE